MQDEEIIKAVSDGISEVKSKLQKQLDEAIEKHTAQVKDAGSAAAEVRSEVKALSEQFAQMQADLTAIAQKSSEGAKGGEEIALTAGEEFVKSEGFKQLVAGQRERVRIDVKSSVSDIMVKNTVISGTGTTFPMQRPGVISGDFAPVTIRSLFRAIPVTTSSVKSLREDAWTNSAAEVSQGAAKPESDLTFEEYDVTIQTVAHWIKVTNQLLADAPAIVQYIDTRLRDGLAQRIDAQLLNGNGTSPNLSGLTDSGNFTVYTPTSSDLLVDAINRAKYMLWAKGYQPDTVIVNPQDWGEMERTREGNGSGMYLYGLPGMPASMNPFGVRIVLSANMTVGNFWIGNIAQAAVLYERSGAVVEMGYVNDDFAKNLVTIRAEERLGLGVEKPSAAYYGAFTA